MLEDKVIAIIIQGGLLGLAALALWQMPNWIRLWSDGKSALATQIQKGHELIQKNCDDRTQSTNAAFEKLVTCVDKNTDVTTQLVTTLKDKK